MTIYLETERLRLRDWRDGDLAAFAALNADPRVMEYFPATFTRAQSDDLARRIRRDLAENGCGLFAVAVKAAENFIGFVGLATARFEAPFTPAVEIGWRLAAGSWGQGYATEAARACLAYGFSKCGFRDIVSFTARSNKRSTAVMERIGMTRNPDDDFEHPALPPGHPLRPHVLYRIANRQ